MNYFAGRRRKRTSTPNFDPKRAEYQNLRAFTLRSSAVKDLKGVLIDDGNFSMLLDLADRVHFTDKALKSTNDSACKTLLAPPNFVFEQLPKGI